MTTTDKYVFFYKSKDAFSNHYISPFSIDGITFNCGEMYMMYHKAKLFNDMESMVKILNEESPKKQKDLGRKVIGFDSTIWYHNCQRIMVNGLKEKFMQNPDICDILLETGDRKIVEASPDDDIWGIGLAEDDPLILDEANWKGKNLLGKVLMEVRNQIKSNINNL